MRQILRMVVGCAIVATLVLGARQAQAQRAAADKAAAEALFDEALELMKDKRYKEACPKLEQSQRIDAGIGTLLYLADCYEKSGRTASAWATFREAASAASAAGQAERARQGKQRADQLEGQLSKLTIMVAPETKALEGLQVTRSGTLVQAPLYDSAVPVDPGEIIIEARAPGYEPFEKTVSVPGNGGRALVQVPALVPAAQTGAAAAPASALASDPAQPAAAEQPPGQGSELTIDEGTDHGSGQRTAGVVLMGVGAAGLVVGSIFGIRAIQKNDDAEERCTDNVCDQKGIDLTDEAKTAALVSNIGFIAGGAALLGGTLLYVYAPDGSEAARLTLNPTVGGASLGYAGRF